MVSSTQTVALPKFKIDPHEIIERQSGMTHCRDLLQRIAFTRRAKLSHVSLLQGQNVDEICQPFAKVYFIE